MKVLLLTIVLILGMAGESYAGPLTKKDLAQEPEKVCLDGLLFYKWGNNLIQVFEPYENTIHLSMGGGNYARTYPTKFKVSIPKTCK